MLQMGLQRRWEQGCSKCRHHSKLWWKKASWMLPQHCQTDLSSMTNWKSHTFCLEALWKPSRRDLGGLKRNVSLTGGTSCCWDVSLSPQSCVTHSWASCLKQRGTVLKDLGISATSLLVTGLLVMDCAHGCFALSSLFPEAMPWIISCATAFSTISYCKLFLRTDKLTLTSWK